VAGPASRWAFTLAEVLITLGIIGVVASMTMPVLIQQHKEKVTVTRVKHAYSVLSQAYEFAVSEDERTPKYWGMGDMYDENTHITLANRFKPHMNVIKDCVGKDINYTSRNCTSVYPYPSSYASFVINNGTVMTFRNWYPQCNFVADGKRTTICGEVKVDINGKNKPNRQGEDIFTFFLTDDLGIVPMGTQGYFLSFDDGFCNKGENSPNTNFYQMMGCTAWVIVNENLDYLKCRDKLGWDKASSCKD